jgi:hypothetical protein
MRWVVRGQDTTSTMALEIPHFCDLPSHLPNIFTQDILAKKFESIPTSIKSKDINDQKLSIHQIYSLCKLCHFVFTLMLYDGNTVVQSFQMKKLQL